MLLSGNKCSSGLLEGSEGDASSEDPGGAALCPWGRPVAFSNMPYELLELPDMMPQASKLALQEAEAGRSKVWAKPGQLSDITRL